ncbi:hypothetical protein [Burkholderia stagnalis]|nr:hypothetical protein [Burkholderia stagnalis]MDY7803275.1 hypothetical protein [Burkholderia stagnalis]VWB60349.1 hypothetical protein BST28156_02834 [Burkholderia stagnalis]
MLDAIVITVGIAAVAGSLFYKFLLLLYEADQRAAARRREKVLRDESDPF